LIDNSVQWVPLALAVGSVLGGLAIREFVLTKDVEKERHELHPVVESL
jgi:CHASE1-domain containing sensor protein